MPRKAEKITKEIKYLAAKAQVDPRTALRWRQGKRVLPAVAVALELAMREATK